MVGNACPTAVDDRCILSAVLYKHMKHHLEYIRYSSSLPAKTQRTLKLPNTSSLGCTSAHSSLLVKPLVLSLKLVASQNTTPLMLPATIQALMSSKRTARRYLRYSIVHRCLVHMSGTAHLTLSWRSLRENYPARRRHFH